jgi:hypothetical protein
MIIYTTNNSEVSKVGTTNKHSYSYEVHGEIGASIFKESISLEKIIESSIELSDCINDLNKIINDLNDYLLKYKVESLFNAMQIDNYIKNTFDDHVYKKYIYYSGKYKKCNLYLTSKCMVGYSQLNKYINLLLRTCDVLSYLLNNVSYDILSDFNIVFIESVKYVKLYGNNDIFDRVVNEFDLIPLINNDIFGININSIQESLLKERINEEYLLKEPMNEECSLEKHINEECLLEEIEIDSSFDSIPIRKSSLSDNGSTDISLDNSINNIKLSKWSNVVSELSLSYSDFGFVEFSISELFDFVFQEINDDDLLNELYEIFSSFGIYKTVDHGIETKYGFFDISEFCALITVMGDVYLFMRNILSFNFKNVLFDSISCYMRLFFLNYMDYLHKDGDISDKCMLISYLKNHINVKISNYRLCIKGGNK